jgi:hypothetical protein
METQRTELARSADHLNFAAGKEMPAHQTKSLVLEGVPRPPPIDLPKHVQFVFG